METCNICRRPIPNEHLIVVPANPIQLYCTDCYPYIGTCATCVNGRTCAFETDTSINIPPVVTKVMRQGNMTIQTQVKNPDRIEQTCAKGCPCFTPEGHCLKEVNGEGCSGYVTVS